MSILFNYILWNVSPDAFTIPFFNHPVRWYGLSWAIGFLLSQQVMYFIYKKEGRPTKEIDDLLIYVLFATVIGARLGHVLFYDPAYYFSNPSQILVIWEGGLASHGAAIVLPIGLYLFARQTKVRYLWILDRMVIITALTGAFIRLGNLMNSEMAGIPTTMPWGFIFTSIDDLPRHPAQLYEALYCFAIFFALFTIWYKQKDQTQDGFLFGLFLIVLFSLRFVDDMILNMGQLLSIPFVLIGVGVLIYSYQQKNKKIKAEAISIN